MTTLRLATDDNMRAITSQTLDEILRPPFLYICTDQPDVMRAWGVAHAATISDYERLYPDALVAHVYVGDPRRGAICSSTGRNRAQTSGRRAPARRAESVDLGQR
jgi:hypothetical protein